MERTAVAQNTQRRIRRPGPVLSAAMIAARAAQGLTGFKHVVKLPAEIQNLIWGFAFQESTTTLYVDKGEEVVPPKARMFVEEWLEALQEWQKKWGLVGYNPVRVICIGAYNTSKLHIARGFTERSISIDQDFYDLFLVD